MQPARGFLRSAFNKHFQLPLRNYSVAMKLAQKQQLTDRGVEFHQNGFVIVNKLFNIEELEPIKREMLEICRGNRGDIDGAKSDNTSSDDELLRKYICVHFPHKISPKVLELATKHAKTIEVLSEVVSPNVKLVQTMMFMKGPGQQGQNWHQDEYYIPTRDKSLCGVWVAIEDATIENGCLWVIPQSHSKGNIYPAAHHDDYENFDRTPRALIEHFNEYKYSSYIDPDKNDKAIPVELKAGDGVFFNGYLLHRSLKNVSDGFRLSFANHYMSAESMLPWNYDDRLKGYIRDSRDITMVCGTDPYEYKGTENLETTKPFVRESVDHNQSF